MRLLRVARNDRGVRAAILIVPILLSGAAGAEAAQRAPIEAVAAEETSGNIQIRFGDGRSVNVVPEGEQKSLSRPAIAEDRQTVGWLANYDSCCQSYPIPRQLTLWRGGRIIRRIDARAMIWNWRFFKGGRAIGLADGPTHGSDVPYSYTLYDVASGRLVSEIAGHRAHRPGWARVLADEPVK